jgi:hypothetical protein
MAEVAVAVELVGAGVAGAEAVAATRKRVLDITLLRNGRSCHTKIATRFSSKRNISELATKQVNTALISS